MIDEVRARNALIMSKSLLFTFRHEKETAAQMPDDYLDAAMSVIEKALEEPKEIIGFLIPWGKLGGPL